MGHLTGAVEIRVRARDDEQVVLRVPVRTVPRFVDDINLHVGRQQSADERTDLRLHQSPRALTHTAAA